MNTVQILDVMDSVMNVSSELNGSLSHGIKVFIDLLFSCGIVIQDNVIDKALKDLQNNSS